MIAESRLDRDGEVWRSRRTWRRFWHHGRTWLNAPEQLLFLTLLGLHLIPIWAFTYFPSQDGPSHLANATILHDYFAPERPLIQEYYRLNTKPLPNWFSHLILTGLVAIVPVLVAEKLFLSVYVILLPISIRYALCAIRSDARFLAILAFPFIYNQFFHLGFYNFSSSLVVFFFVVGYWFKHQGLFTRRQTATLGALTVLLYFCHIVSLVMAYTGIAVLTAWSILLDLIEKARQRSFSVDTLWHSLRRWALPPVCALLPALILVGLFLSEQDTTLSFDLRPRILSDRVWQMLSLAPLLSFERWELVLSLALVGLFAAASLHCVFSKVAQRQFQRSDGCLLVLLAYVLIYLVTPNRMAGGLFVSTRLILYPFFALLFWLAAQTFGATVKHHLRIVTTSIALILLGAHTIKYAELNNYLNEYMSGMHLIEPDRTLLALSWRSRTSDARLVSQWTFPFLHADGYIVAQKHVVGLANYEANTEHFPILFSPQRNPYVHIGRIEGNPPEGDFLTFTERTGGSVDYVLLWGMQEQERDHPATQAIFRQLERGYDLIHTSSERGLMQLYRKAKREGG